MDLSLSELTCSHTAGALLRGPIGEQQRWHPLVSEIGAALAVPLTAAAERPATMASSGRIERARRVGIDSQQVARTASGSLCRAHERLPLERRVDEAAGSTGPTFEFLCPAEDAIDGVSAIEIGSLADGWCRAGAESLGGRKVLVVAQRREVRVEVRDALRHLDLALDFVDSVAAAAAFCVHGAPDAVIVESPLCDARFERMRRDAAAAAPRWVCIELMEDSDAFEMSTDGGATARVGRRGIDEALPSALLFELSKAP